MANPHNLYREHRVYARKANELVLFVCLERLSDGKFAVSQAEFLREGDDLKERMAQIAATVVELMLDEDPVERVEFFDTIVEAVSSHEHAFADMDEWVANAQN
ncbi:hypothetical protein [Allosphingosinicella sp.]|uniref:hypothetical protein n=1 Tax=Allosphingosinicella sp. TaxID=2823234 RepID=UPI002FC14A12